MTSSSASAGGACTGTGVPPTRINGVIGVSKAYITRVGGGPFPTEALDGAGEQIRKRGNEFGAVTGRPRRCGWFDVPLLRYTVDHQRLRQHGGDQARRAGRIRPDSGLRRLQAGRQNIGGMPPTVVEIAAIEPVYEYLPGWSSSTFGMSNYDDLPAKARDYLAFLEQQTGVEVGCISTGPERNQTIVRPGSRFAALVG